MTPPSHKNADQPNYLGGLAAPLHPARSNHVPKTCNPARTEPWRLGRDPHPTSMGRREPVGARGKWREGRRQGRARGPAGSGGGKEKGGGRPKAAKGREGEREARPRGEKTRPPTKSPRRGPGPPNKGSTRARARKPHQAAQKCTWEGQALTKRTTKQRKP